MAETDQEKVTESLNQSFYRGQGVLMEYRPNQDAILVIEIPPENFSSPLTPLTKIYCRA